MNNILPIDKYKPKSDNFFLDANIWLYLFCPLGGYNAKVIGKYDNFLKHALQTRSRIYVSSLVISEFINAYIRLEFKLLQKEYPHKYKDFKRDFRNTARYSTQMNDISNIVKNKILKNTERIDDEFATINIDALFDSIGTSDFNDKYYVSLCTRKDMKIVTNDGDFLKIKTHVDILTANETMLKSRQ